MQSILPFLVALARSNGLAFLIAFGVLVLFMAPLIWRARRAERRYLSLTGAEIPASSQASTSRCLVSAEETQAPDATYSPQEGAQKDGTPRLSARQPTQ